MERQILDISQVNEYIKNLMDGDELLAGLCIRGELSNYKIYPSGHHYFTLKDAGGALRCVMFRSSAARLRFRPENGMKVLYCIGEKDTELDRWDQVLREQLEIGLDGVDKSQVVIGYEPIWSIGPGKTPAGKDYITKIARFIKEVTGGIPVVYGGGLKVDNAEMLASILEIDGGLIALTRFQGEIGFYPDEYVEIIRTYLGK